ncbi:hypothetical protein PF005_g19780 [Phytophthora fragariae]|uniref:Uncharacterized protein n=1 Tax=Phytophthora fragariae TaxID=53985 RepID=A0A6A3XAT0_9STRA|nr:hypothetical protein PF003_g11127 [Phytophthora fragariae]KAE8926653.1 hypothetical protein PF009_g23162 [Phytophthora fragariae]KAE8987233.1 hypothetical protein PF011_g19659 [Phytophthora fragariae]KAE9082154.1 hypothetical protein PF007_g22382 [Phytophthora fragariae]KAE9082294.1 hypothetical protein PF010_g21637 [Phytophthora fragariae]
MVLCFAALLANSMLESTSVQHRARCPTPFSCTSNNVLAHLQPIKWLDIHWPKRTLALTQELPPPLLLPVWRALRRHSGNREERTSVIRRYCGVRKMTFSIDIRWCAIVLVYVYNVDMSMVSIGLGMSLRSLERWYRLFRNTGNLSGHQLRKNKTSRWPSNVCSFVKEYVKVNPCFYFEELRLELRAKFHGSHNLSDSTICPALRFDLRLTRKVLTNRASESLPQAPRVCPALATLLQRA